MNMMQQKKYLNKGIVKKRPQASHNKRYTLRRLFGGSGLEKIAVGLAPFMQFSLTHIPAHRVATQRFIRWAGTSYT